MESFMAITRALSDENRVRALMALNGQELCVCQLIELLELAPSTVSKHMSILRHAKLVEGKKRGRWMYYRLAGADARAEEQKALEFVRFCLLHSTRIQQDKQRLAAILEMDPNEICRQQSGRCG
jgi:DNA-binding transcriptional ArsR family regulator